MRTIFLLLITFRWRPLRMLQLVTTCGATYLSIAIYLQLEAVVHSERIL
mgnify:CR=1